MSMSRSVVRRVRRWAFRAVLGAASLTTVGVADAQTLPVHDEGLLPGDALIAPAENSQQDHSISRGGTQFLMVWSDRRGTSSGSQTIQGDGDIYGIRLDASGQAVDAAPFVVAGGMGLQRYPTAAWNGENWLVLYQSQDAVGGYFETRVRAVRVSPQGQVLDATPILLPPTQFSPDTIGMNVSGLGGRWLVTRCVYHNDGYGTYLAGQRIDGDGTLLDAAPVMLIDWVYGGTRIVANTGEYLVAGPDWNNSAVIRARRIGPDGQGLGAAFNIPGLNIAGDGAAYYVTWVSNFTDIVGSRMTATGTLLEPAGTVLFSDPAVGFYSTSLTHDGVNWWFEWGAGSSVRTLRVSAAGAVLDPGGVPLPIVIGGTNTNAYGVQMAPRAGGGVLTAWNDGRSAMGGDSNVYIMPLSAANAPGAERCVSTSTPNQRSPEVCAGPGGAMAAAFVSEHAGDDRVLVHLLGASGRAQRQEPIEVYRGRTIGRVGVAWNGSLFLVVWDEGEAGLTPTRVRARRMNADGSFADAQPVEVMPGFNAAVGALGGSFLVACARPHTNPQFIDLWVNRVDGPTGQPLDGAAGRLVTVGYVTGAPRVRSDGTQWLVAAHSMWSHNSSQGDAFLARVSPTGVPSPVFNPTPVSGGSGDPDIAFSETNALVVWRMNTLGNANNYIAGRIMNADGTMAPGTFTIAEAAGRQLRPTVSWDGRSYIVAWEDQRNQGAFFDARTDIYGARVSEQGVVLDPAGVALVRSADGDVTPSMVSGAGTTWLASARFVNNAAFDSYRVGLTRLGESACSADFDGDGDVGTDADIEAFFACLAGNCCAACGSADFDGDGDVGTDADIAALFRVLGGGAC